MKDPKNYNTFEFQDFIEDDDFRAWVIFRSKEKDRYWKEFLEAHPHKKETVKEAREFLLQTAKYFESTDRSERDIRVGLEQVLESASVLKINKPKVHVLPIYRWMAAASLAMLMGFFSWYFFTMSDGLTAYTTDFGEWKTVTLLDGSVVKLNANSELVVAEDLSEGDTRQVWLQGEAFFTIVKKSGGTKFQVITDDLTVEVLGTEFNVRNREKQTEVYLQKGKIALDLGVEKEILSPGDFIAFSAETKQIVERKQVTQAKLTSWKEGVLHLNNTSVYEILKKIEEIYGVDIKISAKTMLNEKRTIGVPMKDLEIVIPILEKTLNVEIMKERNKLFLHAINGR